MSHIERVAGCEAVGESESAGGCGRGCGCGFVEAEVDVGADVDDGVGVGAGAAAAVDEAGAAGASALVAPVRNGRSKASLSLATFFGPNPGSCASCAASACAIFAKLCVVHE